MTVILMLAMFAIFLAFDYLGKGKEAALTAEACREAATFSPRSMPTIVAGFDLPENRSYHQGHTWALQESPTLLRVGTDDFGARLAGNIDEIILPKRGQWLRQGQKFVTLVRDSQETELVSPVEGEVTNVNDALAKDANLNNSDPYGEGRFVSVLSPDATTTFRNLLSGSLALKWMAEASHRLQARAPMLAGAVARNHPCRQYSSDPRGLPVHRRD